MRCNCCGGQALENIYSPIGSKTSLMIEICRDCGLVFASSKEIDYSEIKNFEFRALSCDADYSLVRVGKAQMINTVFNLFDSYKIDRGNIKNILDMSSARGHFALKAKEYFIDSIVDCIEPDVYMTDSYHNVDRVNVHHSKYKEFEPSVKYDLIYSCHSLEHYRDPVSNLQWIYSNLIDKGYFYVEVPNIDAVDNKTNIDEFFYDMHLFYFEKNTLENILHKVGFEVVANNTNLGSLAYLCKKNNDVKSRNYINSYEKNSKLINLYKVNVSKNRSNLKSNISKIQDFLNGNAGKTAIVGCGRVLDFLIRYCDLEIKNDTFLIDNFLYEATKTIYGKKIYKLDELAGLTNICKVIILAKTSSNALVTEIKGIWPNVSVLTVSDFLDE
jgi:hypothetical protein